MRKITADFNLAILIINATIRVIFCFRFMKKVDCIFSSVFQMFFEVKSISAEPRFVVQTSRNNNALSNFLYSEDAQYIQPLQRFPFLDQRERSSKRILY